MNCRLQLKFCHLEVKVNELSAFLLAIPKMPIYFLEVQLLSISQKILDPLIKFMDSKEDKRYLPPFQRGQKSIFEQTA
jgi:hypothetical protein